MRKAQPNRRPGPRRMLGTVALVSLLAVGLIAQEPFPHRILIRGSDTMIRLARHWAETFGSVHPDLLVHAEGGGSSLGIDAFIRGEVDICETSRDLTPEEYAQATERGIHPVRYIVARDAIAIYLHPDNPIDELSVTQLRDIYTGRIQNWKQLGGDDAPLVAYGRAEVSGTHEFFRRQVLDDSQYGDSIRTLPSTASIVHAVAFNTSGIGYGGLSWATNVKTAAISIDSTGDAVRISDTTVSNGSYPLSRPLYWFVNGEPTGDLKTLLDWVISNDGQQIAENLDYFVVDNPDID